MTFARLGFSPDGQCNASADAVAVAAGADQFEAEPVVGSLTFISEERYFTV